MLHSWALGPPACLRHLQVKCEGTWALLPQVCWETSHLSRGLSLGTSSLGQSQEELKQRLQSQTARSCSALGLNPALPVLKGSMAQVRPRTCHTCVPWLGSPGPAPEAAQLPQQSRTHLR